jgi:hypothetical protein
LSPENGTGFNLQLVFDFEPDKSWQIAIALEVDRNVTVGDYKLPAQFSESCTVVQ